jgi:hypothetical protein
VPDGDEAGEGVSGYILQQQRVRIVAQRADGTMACEPRQRGGSPLLILLPDGGQDLQDDRVALECDRIQMARRRRGEGLGGSESCQVCT